jgi:hydrogenase nickel incorporation protein HypA/HybF
MHELGITQEIIAVVTERAGERRVRRVVLEIGKLSGVLPDAIQFCFGLCSERTAVEGAELEILQPDGRGRCRRCGAEVAMKAVLARCPCGSNNLEWISGEELRIKEMELA